MIKHSTPKATTKSSHNNFKQNNSFHDIKTDLLHFVLSAGNKTFEKSLCANTVLFSVILNYEIQEKIKVLKTYACT